MSPARVARPPDHVVKQAISLCPSHVLLAGRDPANDYVVGGKQVGFTNFGIGVLKDSKFYVSIAHDETDVEENEAAFSKALADLSR